MEVMDEVCITISKGDVVVFPLEMFCMLLVRVVDISEQPIPYFPNVAVLGPTCLPDEVRSTEDSPDLAWGLHFRLAILQSCPSVINIILQVPATNKLIYLIFQGDTLLGGVTDVFMKSTILIMVPFGAIST